MFSPENAYYEPNKYLRTAPTCSIYEIKNTSLPPAIINANLSEYFTIKPPAGAVVQVVCDGE